MVIKITDECINCANCEPECPNGAIYGSGEEWRFSDRTTLKGNFTLKTGVTHSADNAYPAISDDYFYIVPDKCTECTGFHDEPQCASVCPVDCCVLDPAKVESKDELLEKKNTLHA